MPCWKPVAALAATAVLVTLAIPAPSHAEVAIDEFEDAPFVLVEGDPASCVLPAAQCSLTTSLSGMIDFRVASIPRGGSSWSLSVSPGVDDSVSLATEDAGFDTRIEWGNGVTSSPKDLTEGGANDRIRIEFSSLVGDVIIYAHMSEVFSPFIAPDVTVPSGSTFVEIPFSAFVSGSTPGDFTQFKKLSLGFRVAGVPLSASAGISRVVATGAPPPPPPPDPSPVPGLTPLGLLLLGSSLAVAGLRHARRRR